MSAFAAVLGCSACGGPATQASATERPPRAAPVEIPVIAVAAPPALPRLAGRVSAISEAFGEQRSVAIVAFVEQFFRVRGNHGYHKSLERVEAELRAAGFVDEQIRTLSLGPVRDAWTPVRASLALVGAAGAADEVLHAFAHEREPDRATLLVGSASLASTELEVVLAESTRTPLAGKVVLGRGDPAALYRTYVERGGAAGILTLNLVGYHRADRHRDAAQFGYLRTEEGAPAGFGFSISPRTDERLRAALGRGPTRVRVAVETLRSRSAATGIECTLHGSDPTAAPVVLVAHVDEPGANDNASGVAGLVELARALRTITTRESGALRRSIVFLWGQENEVADAWIEAQSRRPMAGLVLDMIGEDPATVGAPFLVERIPDPGAVWLRAPDEHTAWGSTAVAESRVHGHFLADQVMAAARLRGATEPVPWDARSHPFEGGSDHTSFLDVGVPAVLAWHFPDDAYHTTRDRLDRVSGAEIDRVASTMGAVALTLASATSDDVRELLAIVEHAATTRLAHVADNARAGIPRGEPRATEHRIAAAWTRFYDESLTSVGQIGPTSSRAADVSAVEAARARWRDRAAGVLRAILPTP